MKAALLDIAGPSLIQQVKQKCTKIKC